ncbi:MAG: nicotinate phosphoribosyltransferase, partial [Alistipes sp.]|nr:nicotinate phosphoribosyltransferase [Alistipes sp.]
MIRSILDTDLYKFTTSYAYFKLYPQAIGTFTFNDRAKVE